MSWSSSSRRSTAKRCSWLRALDDRDDGLRHLESLRYLFGLADSQPAHAAPFTPKVSGRLDEGGSGSQAKHCTNRRF
jgi:hypothetical protein